MNTSNYAGMGGRPMGPGRMGQPQMGQPQRGQPQMGQPQMSQPQMGVPQMGQGQAQQILQYLRNQQVPPGWQQTYRVDQRFAFIQQMYVSLTKSRGGGCADDFYLVLHN